MKRYMAVLGSVMFCVVCFSLYLMLETTTGTGPPGQNVEIGENDLSSIEAKIKRIESDLRRNHKTINLIKDTVRDIANGDAQSLNRLQKALAEQGSDNLFLPGEHGIDKGNKMAAGVQGHAGGSDITVRGHVFNVSTGHKVAVIVPKDMCMLSDQLKSTAQVQMQELFKTMSFDNPDGGVWKQGYPITYSESTFAAQPLKVFVVPHSHCDPGWLKTFERYYTDQTRHILNNMVDKLEAYPDMRFIYAEMSFFSRWWAEISEDKRQRTRKLIKNRQLEIATGGWVMTDEANAHYFAMVDQLIEGNQWLLNQVGVKPTSGWAIDPFGHTPTMAYILKRAGFDNMLIQRTHYAVKKELSKTKKLEFKWRQLWDEKGNTDMFCHMMPFYSYDVPHTCGPDPKICCQFDFKRLPGGRVSCPWKIAPVPIGDHNVENRAQMILDQWKKKSTMYQNNVVLVPLGDDFRYDKPAEWDQQYHNYKKLMAYMNVRKDWNVQAQFGTLSDYFAAVRERAGSPASALPAGYPSLSGDFFSYADRDDHYWSGYYTSRPFYKRLDRVLEYHLRGAEIAYSVALTHARNHNVAAFPASDLMKQLVSARRGLGLFQHHDGITGTAKDFVVVDYAEKLLRAILDLKGVTRQAASFLLTKDKPAYTHRDTNPFIDIDETRGSHDALPIYTIMTLTSDPRPVVLYNSLGHARHTVVRLHVDSPYVELRDTDNAVIPTQVIPQWKGKETISDRAFQIAFVAKVPGLGFSRYTIRKVNKGDNQLNVFTDVTFYNGGTQDSADPKESKMQPLKSTISPKHPAPTGLGLALPPQGSSTIKSQAGQIPKDFDRQGQTLAMETVGPATPGPFTVERRDHGEGFTIENSEIKADFSGGSAMLTALTLKETKTKMDVNVEFMIYGTRNQRDKSGAYLFLPGGAATPIPKETPLVRVQRGPISSEVHVYVRHLHHIVTLSNSPGIDSLGVDIMNLVDIRHESNYELVMRVKTGVQNPDKTFYTDLNGFQMIRRQTYSKLTMQGNFYPMPTMAYVQDDTHRFSILSAQSLGVASLDQGQLEIVQDRTLNQDDNRGLGQGVTDNKETPNQFRFHLELVNAKKQQASQAGYPSVTAGLSSRELLHPVMVMPATTAPNPPSLSELLPVFAPLGLELPCELHILNVRTLQGPDSVQFNPQSESALLIHHTSFDCGLPSKGATCKVGSGTVTLSKLFHDFTIKEAISTSLTLTHDNSKIDVTSAVTIPAMEIHAYKVVLA